MINRQFLIGKNDQREVKFTVNGICKMETLLGMPVTRLDDDNLGFIQLRIMLYSGLAHRYRTLTVEETGDIIDELIEEGETFDSIFGKVQEAIFHALGVIEEENEKKKFLAKKGKR